MKKLHCIKPLQVKIYGEKCSRKILVNGLWNRRRPDPNDPDQTTTIGRIPKRPYTP